MKFKVRNWAEYNAGQHRLGSLTLWVTPKVVALWQSHPYPIRWFWDAGYERKSNKSLHSSELHETKSHKKWLDALDQLPAASVAKLSSVLA